MKIASLFVLLVCAAFLMGASYQAYHQLPAEAAAHFNDTGAASGSMRKSSLVLTLLIVGFGVPAFTVTIMFLSRFLPPRFVNLPSADYWRAPGNFQRACDFLFTSSLWFASAFLVWQALLTRAIVEANQLTPPQLDNGRVMLLTGVLLAFTLGWVILLLVRFSKPR